MFLLFLTTLTPYSQKLNQNSKLYLQTTEKGTDVEKLGGLNHMHNCFRMETFT